MMKVGRAMSITEAVSAKPRPFLSANCPKSKAPNGLARKPAAKAPKAAMVDESSSVAGKNCLPIIAAKNPYTPKSYHSMVVPTVPTSTFLKGK